ncbi:MAG: pyridoxamine 5'-phosphate oxidase [Nocardioides sp.]|uniref:pyridoxamine 5'-phosphate oxidase n=1 Tax=Nocardioides sp. TaxID=35761 RepID=UPI0039E57B85
MAHDDARPDWAALRADYARGGLDESDLAADPFEMFRRWLADAIAAELTEPNAMVIATVSAAGQPSARMVLLKGYDNAGFVFFTNLQSRKGRDLTATPACSLLFPWHPLERQVRIEGSASVLSRDDVADYFAARPRPAQLGAWASHQSTPVGDRAELQAAYDDAEVRFADVEVIPPPDEWGGFRVAPESFEFWQGRAGRMHDRLVYRRTLDGWATERLAP